MLTQGKERGKTKSNHNSVEGKNARLPNFKTIKTVTTDNVTPKDPFSTTLSTILFTLHYANDTTVPVSTTNKDNTKQKILNPLQIHEDDSEDGASTNGALLLSSSVANSSVMNKTARVIDYKLTLPTSTPQINKSTKIIVDTSKSSTKHTTLDNQKSSNSSNSTTLSSLVSMTTEISTYNPIDKK